MPTAAKIAVGIGVLVLVGLGLYLLEESPETLEALDPTGTLEMKKRFDEVDRRIDSFLPKGRGVAPSPSDPVEESDFLTVVLTRENADDPKNAWTRIQVDGREVFHLPKGDFDDDDAAAVQLRTKLYDVVFEDVAEALAEAWKRRESDPNVKGRIETPAPSGVKVPDGDLIRVLDAFIQVGIKDVLYEGAPPPKQAANASAVEPDER